jgi:hypothetical protein
MSVAATVSWFPSFTMSPSVPHGKIPIGSVERKFDDLERAIRFVMENLPDSVRHSAMIYTDNATMEFPDIERLYNGL